MGTKKKIFAGLLLILCLFIYVAVLALTWLDSVPLPGKNKLIESKEELLNFLTFQCGSLNDDIMFCENYGKCDPEIPNINQWRTYIDKDSAISFLYPPMATIDSTKDHITISNIKLSETSPVADSISIARRYVSIAQATKETNTPSGIMNWGMPALPNRETYLQSYDISRNDQNPEDSHVFILKLTEPPRIGWFGDKYVYIEEYLKKYGDTPMEMLEIKGTNHRPSEWGKAAPNCGMYETPTEKIYYSITY